ncbi:hypothetical protein MH117_01535 [Paenibacillus sp. ACRRX]|uniref:hypothetical protein n=1 Tax=unclassified Paenibacillus TaxID=185978 RepID=UPI001EF72115|nr:MULTISPECIES: hypothetical protein [unclassified Paenibacillus]MCG7406084.1 hypothetical protein [Paenibacillus sp. ACRRX]MDK8182538.1 hypothetical protein [Paenibacillus sp. UMB4589-SE434]
MDEQLLDQYRQQGILVRVVRDLLEINDVKGIVVAWDDDSIMIRKPNRRIVKLKRSYLVQPIEEPRKLPPGLLEE